MHVRTDCSSLIKPDTISLQDSAKYFLSPGDNHGLNLKLILGSHSEHPSKNVRKTKHG